MPIKRLSQSLVNKIAAGEVIERPASVVKELMENAVDAGATRVDVSVTQGGLETIRVADNGGGIPAEELPLALAAHATSKIVEADDLFRVATLGFRGEALASVAEVSRLLLRSRTPESPAGAEIGIAGGGALGVVSPCGCPVGTTVEVRDLFFNTPVRRKFLRATATEFGHVSEAFTRIALATPQVHFTLRHNDKPVHELPAGAGWLDRIAALFGRELAGNLIWVESREDEVELSGFAAHPSQSRSHNRMQYFFLNGRHIRDRALQHALGEAYRGLLMVGRFPVAFLAMKMPPEMVDVNVHPTKLEVRFQDSGRLYSQLLAMLRGKFLLSDLTARGTAPATAVAPSGEPMAAPGDAFAGPSAEAHDPARAAQWRQQLVDWAKGKVASWQPADDDAAGGFSPPPHAPLMLRPLHQLSPHPLGEGPGAGADFSTRPLAGEGPGVRAEEGSGFRVQGSAAATGDASPAQGEKDRTFPRRPAALQVHNRYLVTESDDGVTIIDQHALHERILYQQLRDRVAAGAGESQGLLVPEPVDLSPTEAAAALEHRDLLAELGMRIEPFGGDTILLSGYPAMLANLNPADVLRSLLDEILAGVKRPDRRDLLDELLHTIACKAAIKAGDRLAPEEIAVLLEQRHLVDDAHHCPHGRPASLVFTREELDRQFKRV
jgi:DNA mismatch repair protein MutL